MLDSPHNSQVVCRTAPSAPAPVVAATAPLALAPFGSFPASSEELSSPIRKPPEAAWASGASTSPGPQAPSAPATSTYERYPTEHCLPCGTKPFTMLWRRHVHQGSARRPKIKKLCVRGDVFAIFTVLRARLRDCARPSYDHIGPNARHREREPTLAN